ncbi:MAG: lipopolysaccharide biosynthesis protein [Pseudomonadota bacterium]
MKSVRRSIALSFLENYTTLFISFVSSVIIARILTPHDIGVFSIGIAIVGMAHMLRDFGIGQYLIQEKELTPEGIQAAFSLTLVIAWALALVIFLAGGPVSRLYESSEVWNVMSVLSVNFLLIPFGSVTMAVLRRQMDFLRLYWIKTSAALAHAGVAIGLAFLGYGYLSLALASTSGILATVVVCALVRPRGLPWKPGFSGLKHVLRFGSYVTGGRLATELGNAFPELVIGKAIDIPSVGIFGRAMGLIDLFNRAFVNAVWSVMLPHFADVARKEGSLKESFLQSVRLTTAVAWPFFTFMGLMAFPLVRALYGDQWDASVPLVRILCVWGGLGAMFFGYSQLVTAMGLPRILAQVEVLGAVLKTAFIAATVFFGLVWVAVGLILWRLVMNYVMFRNLAKLVALQARELFRALGKSAALSAATAAGPLFALLVLGGGNVFFQVLLALPLAVLGWLAAAFGLKHELAGEISYLAARLRVACRRAL